MAVVADFRLEKIAAKRVHPRSCASNSVLAIHYVRRQPYAPPTGSGRPPSGAQSPETTPELPGEPPKIDLHGVDGVDESSCPDPANPPFHPTSTTLRRWRGRATLLPGLIAPSETISATLQGQERQRCGGAPSSGTARRLTGGESLTPYFGPCQGHATHL